MKNICINPIDDDIRLQVEALNIKNEFKRLGFTAVGGFVGVVQQNIDQYRDYKKVARLMSFWQGRVKDDILNKQLHNLLDKLKTE